MKDAKPYLPETLEDALLLAERYKRRPDYLCGMCADPQSDGARKHAEMYRNQNVAEAAVVILARELRKTQRFPG